MKRGDLDTDPALLPGERRVLSFKTFAETQRFDALMATVRDDNRWSDRPTLAEAVLAALNDRSYLAQRRDVDRPAAKESRP